MYSSTPSRRARSRATSIASCCVAYVPLARDAPAVLDTPPAAAGHHVLSLFRHRLRLLLPCTSTDPVRKEYNLSPLPLQPVDEPSGKPYPDLVLFARILAVMVEIGVVVHLDDVNAFRRLLQIHSIEPITDTAGRAHGDIDYLRRGFGEAEHAETALLRLSAALVIDNLPVLLGHQILH